MLLGSAVSRAVTERDCGNCALRSRRSCAPAAFGSLVVAITWFCLARSWRTRLRPMPLWRVSWGGRVARHSSPAARRPRPRRLHQPHLLPPVTHTVLPDRGGILQLLLLASGALSAPCPETWSQSAALSGLAGGARIRPAADLYGELACRVLVRMILKGQSCWLCAHCALRVHTPSAGSHAHSRSIQA
jgi:hypothetical protein